MPHPAHQKTQASLHQRQQCSKFDKYWRNCLAQIKFLEHQRDRNLIQIDTNLYGNIKYYQGFAFVFSTNAPSDGSKNSGLGYDGINNAVAFEFDFVQNPSLNDVKSPHFSAHYNLNGAISSVSRSECTVCNKVLPNFDDSNKENFIDDIEIIIQVFGGKINLYTDKW